MRAEASVKITCPCFPKPQMDEDLIWHGGANNCHKKPLLCDLCALCGEKRDILTIDPIIADINASGKTPITPGYDSCEVAKKKPGKAL